MSVIQGVLFDIGGVLLGSANAEIRTVLSQWIGGDLMALRKIFAQEYFMVDRGQMQEEQLQALIQAHLKLDVPSPAEELAEAWWRGSQPDEAMFDLARRLKASDIRIGLLSNTQPTHVAMMREMGFADIFDSVVYSCEVNARKPEPEIYRLGASRLGTEPERTLFIDDLPANVEGARAMGMQAILHRSAAETEATVSRLVGST